VSGRFQAPKGTFDVLPEEAVQRARVEQTARSIFELAGYGRLETPIFEDTELFERGVGQSTDIVNKEMFTFEDQGGRSLTLRPEATASICRAYVEHGMHKLPQPVKLWCIGPFFRHERPQAGRFRQFTQIDAEAIGTDSPLADAELIGLLDRLLHELGVPGVELRLGSLGSLEARARYLEDLKRYLHEHEGDLSKEVRERIDLNPLRAFDADHEGTRAVMEGAPKLLDQLDDADAEHFQQVRSLLDAAGVSYSLDPTLVRGLDYYTRTIFSFVCDALGAQSEVAGGGRYDGLVEQLGGPATPAIGWAAGIERILLALDATPESSRRDAFVAVAGEGRRAQALAIVTELRSAGLAAETDLADRSLKGQIRQADRVGARWTLILEEDGSAQLRDMSSGDQRDVDPADAVKELTRESESR
jgi:histidyl-tRNA synthetase